MNGNIFMLISKVPALSSGNVIFRNSSEVGTTFCKIKLSTWETMFKFELLLSIMMQYSIPMLLTKLESERRISVFSLLIANWINVFIFSVKFNIFRRDTLFSAGIFLEMISEIHEQHAMTVFDLKLLKIKLMEFSFIIKLISIHAIKDPMFVSVSFVISSWLSISANILNHRLASTLTSLILIKSFNSLWNFWASLFPVVLYICSPIMVLICIVSFKKWIVYNNRFY